LKIYSLKRTSIPKIAVLATGLTAAIVAGTMTIAPAQASPSYASACTGCHTAGGSVKATPSSASLAPGATYTVALAFTGGTSPVGYWISGNGASVTASTAGPATMTAPAAAGSYTYTVWMRSGVVASTTYSITVATVPPTTIPPTTIPPTTIPPTTIPPTTIPPTTIPPTTVPPTTVPPTTVPPTTVPPTTVPPTTVPPTTVPPTTIPPVSTVGISSLSPNHGQVGTYVTIRGTGFGTPGVVKFGAGVARVSSWSSSRIVVKVPSTYIVKVESNHSSSPVWYQSSSVLVTVTPSGAAASNAVRFRMESSHHGDDD
jgi:hypothetical protein